MKPPFSLTDADLRRRVFWPLLGLTLLIIFVFNLTGAPLNTAAAPCGILSYELAGSVSNAEAILASWDSIARERAAFSLGLDFLFIPVYVSAITCGCGMAAGALRRRGWPLASLDAAAGIAWGLFLAGLLDVVENIALSIVLFGIPTAPWPQVAYWCALPKFALVFFGIVYAFLGAAVHFSTVYLKRK
ncbi:MAG: hypothetical protein U9Q82_04255 [Chloroflexota bacterium]|nr:hypothetical protein [Chloroflexota bacterium]